MDPTVTASIIGGVCTVTAPVLTYVITRYIDDRDKLIILRDRRDALKAKWIGTIHQEHGSDGDPLDYPITATFSAKRKQIDGTAVIRVPEEDNKTIEIDLTFNGGFLHGRFLQLDYISKDKSIVQFGSVVLELDARGKRLNGRFTGYGARVEKIISGSIDMQRSA
jgi:hypothetical protein